MFGASAACCTVIPNSTMFEEELQQILILRVAALHGEGEVRRAVLHRQRRRERHARALARLDDVEGPVARIGDEALRALAQPNAGVPRDHRRNPPAARRHRDDPALLVRRLRSTSCRREN